MSNPRQVGLSLVANNPPRRVLQKLFANLWQPFRNRVCKAYRPVGPYTVVGSHRGLYPWREMNVENARPIYNMTRKLAKLSVDLSEGIEKRSRRVFFQLLHKTHLALVIVYGNVVSQTVSIRRLPTPASCTASKNTPRF